MKTLLTIALFTLACAPSYGAFNSNGNGSGDLSGSGYSGGYKTDVRNGGYNADSGRNDFYEDEIDDANAGTSPNTNKAASPAPAPAKVKPAATAATKTKEEKPVAVVPKSSSDAGKKIQKVTKGDVVTYSWASPNEVTQNKQDEQTEIIEVAAAPSTNSSGFGGVSQTKQSQWASQFTMFPQDENGWSIIKPQVDSRIIFVSSSTGNDSKAKAYFSKDIDNPYNPSKKIVAFKTIQEAVKLVRDGYPDWVLLKKGDVWQSEQTIWLPSGKSSAAPIVITSYGSSNKRPLIKTGVGSGISLGRFRSYVSIIGLEFYANQRDPDSVDFVGWNNIKSPRGFSSVAIPGADSIGKKVESLHLEGNIFNFFAAGIIIDGKFPQENIRIRRNQILNSYSVNSHGQGMYSSTSSILLDENLFDHNGWYQQNYESLNSQARGQATIYNHSIYISNMFDTVVTGNIFSRSSSIGIKMTSNSDSGKNTVKVENITIKDNLFLEGEIGISAGGNQDFNNGFRWRNFSIVDNVMLHVGFAQPTRRKLAWHIDVQDWDGGLVDNNHLLYNDNPNVTDVSGIAITGFTRNVAVTNNVVRSLGGDTARMVYKFENETLENITMSQNIVSAVDPNRVDLITYFGLSTVGNGVQYLVDKVKTQSKESWNKSYTAGAINKYLRRE